MVFPLLPLIGAGISAVGQIIGAKAASKPQTTTSEVDYVKMAENAERAGFNPLTAIRNGGAAGFTTTHHPALSAQVGFGEAISTVGNALMSFDPRADERADLEQQLMRAQLKRIQDGGTKQSMWSMDVPTAAQSTTVNGAGRPASPPGKGGTAIGEGWLTPPTDAQATSKNAIPIWVPGIDRDGKKVWIPNPDGPDIEQLAFGVAARSQSGWEAAMRETLAPNKVKVTKVPKEEPSSWWPSFAIDWK